MPNIKLLDKDGNAFTAATDEQAQQALQSGAFQLAPLAAPVPSNPPTELKAPPEPVVIPKKPEQTKFIDHSNEELNKLDAGNDELVPVVEKEKPLPAGQEPYFVNLKDKQGNEVPVAEDQADRLVASGTHTVLFLFGRGQDVGFQKAIDGSPRKRHHVRFWALSIEEGEETLGTPEFWLNIDRPPLDAPALWVGAGTKDTGISLTRFTFQITHRTDADADAERDFIVSELTRVSAIMSVTSYAAGQSLRVGRVNRYVTDGELAAASLA